jgi:hypothetical protein
MCKIAQFLPPFLGLIQYLQFQSNGQGSLMGRDAQPKKKKMTGKKNDSPDGLWIAPRYSLKGPQGERAWENRRGGAPNSSKYLELADIALGLKKPELTFKKRRSAAGAHDTSKTEPYSKV